MTNRFHAGWARRPLVPFTERMDLPCMTCGVEPVYLRPTCLEHGFDAGAGDTDHVMCHLCYELVRELLPSREQLLMFLVYMADHPELSNQAADRAARRGFLADRLAHQMAAVPAYVKWSQPPCLN